MYDPKLQYYRLRKMKVINLDKDAEGKVVPHVYSVDGEDCEFNTFVKMECLEGKIDVIVDLDHIYELGYAKDRKGFF